MPLVWLWCVLLNDLRVEWTVNPQYAYGWAVPFLCIFLLLRKIFRPTAGITPPATANFRLSPILCQIIFGLLALLYLPARLIQEANPGWRLVSWALAISVIGITLCVLRSALGASRLQVSGFRFQVSDFAFPLFFFLVAVPWPTLIENPLIQTLTHFDVRATCDLAGWLGIPAIPHANVIEVATGLVGIDEACSGIRSFQATLMISLFLGEYYALGLARRLFCVGCGFLLALLLNLVRLLVLVWVAAQRGIPATTRWHDPTGVFILLGCFFVLWGIGVWLAPAKAKLEVSSQQPATGSQNSKPSASELSVFRFPFSAVALTGWLLCVQVGVEGWYRWHETRLPAATVWQVAWPTNNPTFTERDIPVTSRQILRFDDGRNAGWQEDNLNWQVIFLHWQPGRAAVRLAQNHTPEVCLAAVGHQLTGGRELQFLAVNGLKMPFRFYQLTDTPQPVFVAYCLWNDRAGSRKFETSSLTASSRIAAVRAGQRNAGQRSLEIALTGLSDLAAAQTAVQQLLEKIIVPER